MEVSSKLHRACSLCLLRSLCLFLLCLFVPNPFSATPSFQSTAYRSSALLAIHYVHSYTVYTLVIHTMFDIEARANQDSIEEARHLLRTLTTHVGHQDPTSGTRTPAIDRHLHDLDYVPPPESYKPGIAGLVLTSALEKLKETGIDTSRFDGRLPPYDTKKHSRNRSNSPHASGNTTPGGTRRPKWYAKSDESDEKTLTQVADIITRKKYLLKLCEALMVYGAPTHRLEEYMRTSARALGVDAEFLYLPACMICYFNEPILQQTSVDLVRNSQGIDLGKFKEVYSVYKCVIHAKYDPEDALRDIEEIKKRPNRYRNWFRVLAFGVAAVTVSPFAFSARPIDFIPIFFLGMMLGILQLLVVPHSEQFSHVFEVFASVITAFVARGLGSIPYHGKPLFCFSALSQSSIALILPGYIILNAALELQSRNMVSGSVRMVYAIIYTLFLGFGLLIGTTVFGLMYTGATDAVTCDVPYWWSASNNSPRIIYVKFIWVPIFTVCLAIINQAKWRQMPVMTFIAFCGYQANYWISTHVSSNIQVANAIGAFVIGAIANLYSRFFHGLAAAAMLPAIFVQVPGGLAASGSLVAGITSANQITGNATGQSVISNGTQGFLAAQDNTQGGNQNLYGGTIFNVGYGMVQVAIGISVGLYLSALLVYPYGKRKSGLFSF